MKKPKPKFNIGATVVIISSGYTGKVTDRMCVDGRWGYKLKDRDWFDETNLEPYVRPEKIPSHLPKWMRPYRLFIHSVSGTPGSSAQIQIEAQMALLKRLHDHGALPDKPNEFRLGQTVKSPEGYPPRTGIVTEVLWTIGYCLDDEQPEHLYQPDELEKVK